MVTLNLVASTPRFPAASRPKRKRPKAHKFKLASIATRATDARNRASSSLQLLQNVLELSKSNRRAT